MNDSMDINKILQFVEKYGFKFYGYDENKVPLLVAPNNQIVSLKEVLEFFKKKKNEISQIESRSSVIENVNKIEHYLPYLDLSVEVVNRPDQAIEKKEAETNKVDMVKDKSSSRNNTNQIKTNNNDNLKLNVPIGVGYLPASFDPLDIKSTQEFINRNSHKDLKDTKKWIATLWMKFLAEQGLSDSV